MAAVTSSSDALASIGAGAAAGVLSTCVVNPLDTLRVRLAASRDATGSSTKRIIPHIKALFSSGFREGFGKGLLINLLASTPSNAVYLSSYKIMNDEATNLGLSHHVVPVISAFGAVCSTNFTLSPLFVLRTRVQIDPSRSFIHYARLIHEGEGLRGFYRGTLTNIAGRVVEEATFWYIYDMLKRTTKEGRFTTESDGSGRGHHATESLLSFIRASASVLGLSMAAKLFGTSISYPYNVIMIHLREVDKRTGQHRHQRIWPTIRHVYAADGLTGFYKGLSPHLMRSVLSKATQIYSFEFLMSLWELKKH